jgi:hypothetical protein
VDEPLDGIDWTDLCHLGTELIDAEPDPRHRDLHGQHHRGEPLTAKKLHTMTDVPITGSYL